MEYSPKTTTIDYYRWERQHSELQSLYTDREIDNEELISRMAELDLEFAGSVDISDKYTFKNENDYVEFLENFLTQGQIQSRLEQERKFVKKAARLGYRLQYVAWLLDEGSETPWVETYVEHTSPVCRINFRRITEASLCDKLHS
jgi:hypothetical protein